MWGKLVELVEKECVLVTDASLKFIIPAPEITNFSKLRQ